MVDGGRVVKRARTESKFAESTGNRLGSGRRAESRGAALIEMAILMPLLILLIIGIFEFGAAFKDFLTTSNSVRVGTRILSAKGDISTADCHALKAAVESMGTATTISKISSIEIYQANSAGDQIAGETNTYLYTGSSSNTCSLSLTDPMDVFEGWVISSAGVLYPPGDRIVLVEGTYPLDLVGLRINYTHDWLSGFPPFRGSINIDEQAIIRLEPQGVAVP